MNIDFQKLHIRVEFQKLQPISMDTGSHQGDSCANKLY